MNKPQIKHLFNSYPYISELYLASDGSIYIDPRSALEYAQHARLTDTEISTVTREEAEGWSEPNGTKKASAVTKHILTDEDLKANPDLVEQGLKVGDEIEIPSPAQSSLAGAAKKSAPKKSAAKGAVGK